MFGRAPRLILGREYDLADHAMLSEEAGLALRDLSSHILCVTQGRDAVALGDVLIEQVLLQDVPCIVFDPLGRMLTDEFARSHDEFAARVSVRRCRLGAAESEGIFGAFISPPDPSMSWQRQGDLMREHIARLCSILLERLGRESDPARSREHALLTAIFESTWRAGQRILPADLVQMINHPPLTRLGGFDMDVYLPVDERTALALAFSEFAAASGFEASSESGAIDVAALLQPDRASGGSNPAGRTRATVFDLSALDERDRRFFAATVLAQLLLWMRMKSGVPHLRCVAYFDEADTFDPEPLRALLRFGRAAGFGIALQTSHADRLDADMLTRMGVAIVGAGMLDAANREALGASCPALDHESLEERLPKLEAGTWLLSIGAGRDRPQPPLPTPFRLSE